MKQLIYAVLLLPLLGSINIAAEEPDSHSSTSTITWQECVDKAMTNNPTLIAKRLAVEQGKYNFRENSSLNAYIDGLSLTHSYKYGGDYISEGHDTWSTSALSLSETIYSKSVQASVKSSELSYKNAEIAYKVSSASLRKDLYSAFMTLLIAQEEIKVNQKVVEMREENANLLKLKYESGKESRGNMMYAVAQEKQAKVSLAESERAKESAARDLLKILGEDYRPVSASADLAVPELNFDTSTIKGIIENVPSILSQKNTINIKKSSLDSAKADYYPTLTASQSYGGDSESYEFPHSWNSWSVGLSLNIPIMPGGPTKYKNSVKSAEAAVKAEKQNLADDKLTLESNVYSAYDDFINACETVYAGDALLAANEERYKESFINYMAGNISFIDLESIEQTLIESRRNQLSYLKNANVNKITLESLLGITLEEGK